MAICYDCGIEIDDFVIESRQDGGGHNDAITYSDVPVHANRKECRAIRKETKLWEDLQRLPNQIKRIKDKINELKVELREHEGRLKLLRDHRWGAHLERKGVTFL